MTEQQQRELARGLKALADLTREARAGEHVEGAILAEMATHAARPHVRTSARQHAARQHVSTQHVRTSARSTQHAARSTFLPLAAALVLAVGGALWTARMAPVPEPIQPAGFVALPQASALPQMESASIVRVSLPVTALPVYGVAIQPDVTSGSVEAELLVAQDGQARAIRLVNDSNTSRSMNNE